MVDNVGGGGGGGSGGNADGNAEMKNICGQDGGNLSLLDGVFLPSD
jgi:hypothetical protein